ncbi:MAG TPA: hypothetical protein VG651_24930 [Stellaceae bacterium]|nr:hypothetical protein [Stellaceae bacterium]
MQGNGEGLLIDFGAAGNSGAFCRSGWSRPEPRHTWTLGRDSTLELPRPLRPGTYCLAIELGPFVWQGKLSVQRLTVLVNGSQVAAFDLREMRRIECVIPWPILAPRDQVAVTFVHPDAAKPSDIKGVPDHREIALAFERLHFFCRSAAGEPELADEPLDRLMMRFESLGENCEFGLVQRRCGAEPLGLLRFASAPLDRLLPALEHRFDGLGEPGQVDVRASDNQSEYLVVDRRFGFLYHPWVLVGEAAPEQVRQREAMRLPFLRRKLLEDLEEGRKLLVYHAMQAARPQDPERLFLAIRGYGPGTLLWVELADGAHRAGTVETVRPGLLKGFVDRFAPGENAHDLSLDCWIEICRNACRLTGVDRSG